MCEQNVKTKWRKPLLLRGELYQFKASAATAKMPGHCENGLGLSCSFIGIYREK